jgi:hypothetical protein
MLRRSCRRRNYKEHTRLQQEGCSPKTTLHQVSSSRRRSELARSNNNSHKYSKFQRQNDPQQRNRVSPLLYNLINQVSQFGLKIQSSQLLDSMLRVVTLVQHIMTEFNGAVRRRQNNGHYQSCIKPHETKWSLELIGPSKF